MTLVAEAQAELRHGPRILSANKCIKGNSIEGDTRALELSKWKMTWKEGNWAVWLVLLHALHSIRKLQYNFTLNCPGAASDTFVISFHASQRACLPGDAYIMLPSTIIQRQTSLAASSFCRDSCLVCWNFFYLAGTCQRKLKQSQPVPVSISRYIFCQWQKHRLHSSTVKLSVLFWGAAPSYK